MSVIAVAAAKSSPGVSLVAELLAQLSPARPEQTVLLDCDPAGSDWLLRPGLVPEPGLASLAMAGRRGLDHDELLAHAQILGDGLRVVVGPAAARQATSALEMVGERLVDHVRHVESIDVVIDCGMLAPASPALPLVLAADLVVLVSRPTAAGVIHLAPWVEQLVGDGAAVAVVLAQHGVARGHPSYSAAEVAEALGVDVLGMFDDDPPTAARLHAAPGCLAPLVRTRLVRSMQPIAAAAFAAGTLGSSPTFARPWATSADPAGAR